MDEYIKREAAIERLKKNLYASNPGSFSYLCFQDAINSVQEIPAADVEPVKRGRWDGDTCTSCNLPWNYNMTQNAQDWGYFDPMPDYCPNCGARMDEEGQNVR